MADVAVVARPYAKALFDYAVSQKQLAAWSDALLMMVAVVQEPQLGRLVLNPNSTLEQHVSLILSPFSPKDKMRETYTQWVTVLAQARRLLALPEIFRQFQRLRDAFEKTMEVAVHTFMPLTEEQSQKLQARLSEKLGRKVALNMIPDESLLGGVRIVAGDNVIDGSVLGQLHAMKERLLGE